jgi:hypothetical protein
MAWKMMDVFRRHGMTVAAPRLLNSGWLEWFRNIVAIAQDWIVDVTRRFSPVCAVCSPKTVNAL